MTVYASWNGATEVTPWQVRTGPSPDRLDAAAATPRSGFETAITMPATSGYLSVVGLDASGDRLGIASPIPI